MFLVFSGSVNYTTIGSGAFITMPCLYVLIMLQFVMLQMCITGGLGIPGSGRDRTRSRNIFVSLVKN